MSTIDTLGTFERRGEELEVRFERLLPRPPETVWRALTDPERLSDWMGKSELEPRVGGRIRLLITQARPMTGVIQIWEPHKVLEFSWSNGDAPNSVVRYELTPEGDGTRLVFTQKRMPYLTCALMLPGWHFLFTRLHGLMDEVAQQQTRATWKDLQTRYVEHYQLRGVHLEHPAP